MTVKIKTAVEMEIPSLLPSETSEVRGVYSEEKYQEILKSFVGVGRDVEDFEIEEYGVVDYYSLDEMFSRRVGGTHNKNIVLFIGGEMGSGKSMVLLSLALGCSRWLAHILGGEPSDYFTFNNVVVIDPEAAHVALENLKKHNVYILDDFGVAMDSRRFMTKDSVSMSHILMTARPSNNIFLISAPEGSMVDCRIHKLTMYYSEVSESHHDEGITFIKVLKVVQMFRDSKIRYVYTTKKNVSGKRHYAFLPPKELRLKYEKVRKAAGELVAQKRNLDAAAKEEKTNGPKKQKHRFEERFTEQEFVSFMDVYVKEKTPTTQGLIAEALKTDRSTLRGYMNRYGFEAEKIPKTKEYVIVRK